MSAKRNVLGRGLGALMDDAEVKISSVASINEIEIDKIDVNPFQPRAGHDDDSLKELTGSVRRLGIIQPVTVRKSDTNRYQLITGERRLKAAQLAGLNSVPAYIRTADDQGMLEMALVENIQREDLNAIEIALAYQRLIEECHLTQESMSERVGKKRATIANYLRLLKLPAEVQMGVKEQKISMGHARAIAGIEDPETQLMLYQQIIQYDFSVRKVEEIVRQPISEGKESISRKRRVAVLAEKYVRLRENLKKKFDAPVVIRRNEKGKGKIIISFETEEELEKIIKQFEKIKT